MSSEKMEKEWFQELNIPRRLWGYASRLHLTFHTRYPHTDEDRKSILQVTEKLKENLEPHASRMRNAHGTPHSHAYKA